jgi:hypothetical protein
MATMPTPGDVLNHVLVRLQWRTCPVLWSRINQRVQHWLRPRARPENVRGGALLGTSSRPVPHQSRTMGTVVFSPASPVCAMADGEIDVPPCTVSFRWLRVIGVSREGVVQQVAVDAVTYGCLCEG